MFKREAGNRCCGNREEQKVNRKKTKLLLWIFVALIFLLVYFIFHYGVAPKADALVDADGDMLWLADAVKTLKYLLWAGFIAALYMIGRMFHFDKKPYSEQAAATGRKAYDLAAEILETVKAGQLQPSDTVVKEVKRIHDILKNETEFGVGSEHVISCETEIYSLLKKLKQDVTMYAVQAGGEPAEQKVLEGCAAVKGKLRLRMELKKGQGEKSNGL